MHLYIYIDMYISYSICFTILCACVCPLSESPFLIHPRSPILAHSVDHGRLHGRNLLQAEVLHLRAMRAGKQVESTISPFDHEDDDDDDDDDDDEEEEEEEAEDDDDDDDDDDDC